MSTSPGLTEQEHKLRRRLRWMERLTILAILSIGARFVSLLLLADLVWTLMPGVLVCVAFTALLMVYDFHAGAMNRAAIAQPFQGRSVAVVPSSSWFAVILLWLSCGPVVISWFLVSTVGVYGAWLVASACEVVTATFVVVAVAAHARGSRGFGLLRGAPSGEVAWQSLDDSASAPTHFRVGALVFRDGGLWLPNLPGRAVTVPDVTPEGLVIFLGGVPVRAPAPSST